jgi:hypothetical protein
MTEKLETQYAQTVGSKELVRRLRAHLQQMEPHQKSRTSGKLLADTEKLLTDLLACESQLREGVTKYINDHDNDETEVMETVDSLKFLLDETQWWT